MISKLLERLAPHDVDEAVDDRTFLRRLADADEQRAQNPHLLWSSPYRDGLPAWEAVASFQWTHWGLGVDVEHQSVGQYWNGHTFITVAVGPWAVTLCRDVPRKVTA